MKALFVPFIILLLSATNSYSQVAVAGSNGTDGSYTTLTDITGAFAALNSVTQAGKIITITLNSDPAELSSGNVALTGASGMWASLTISPNGARTVSASVADSPLINLSGVQHVTIDGLNAGGNSLTIVNSNSSVLGNGTCTIQFILDASNNTIKNCTILGSPCYFRDDAIIYFNSASSSGNDNNTITQCNIGPASNTLSNYQAILSYNYSITPNSSNTITNNDIYGFSTYGIDLSIGTGHSWVISNNSFYRDPDYTYVGVAFPWEYPINAIYINSSAAGNFTISGNYIGGTTPNGGLPNTPWDLGLGDGNGFQAIQIEGMSETGPATKILGNRIQNFISEATEEDWPFDGIWVSQGIVNIGDGTDANQNIIGNPSPALGVNIDSTFYVATIAGIYIDADNSSAITINNNVIANIAFTGSQNSDVQLYGVYYYGAAKPSVSNCKIYNLSNACSYNGTPVDFINPVLAGIYNFASGASSGIVTGNEIYNLTASSSAEIESLYGISLNGTGTNPAKGIITDNFIHNLVLRSVDTSVNTMGIDIEGGNFEVYNNIIQLGIDTSGNSIMNGYGIYGINYAGGDSYGNSFYNNSVYIGGTGVASLANTFCFYRGAPPLNAFPADTVEDNIFFNDRQNGSGSVNNYAIADNGNHSTLVSNYNDIYAATSDVASIVSGSAAATTFAGWKATGLDAKSISGNPLFAIPNGSPADFHLTAGTPCDAVGLLIPFITLDYYGSIRANYTPVDLGAVVYKASNGNVPVANFLPDDTTFCAYTCINFFDHSSNNPTRWTWSFFGGSPSSSPDSNPQNICYLDTGTYQVKLVLSNSAGEDSISKFIMVKPTPPPPHIKQSNDTLHFTPDTSYISVQWLDSNRIIPLATDTFLVINHGSDYTVEVTNRFGCKTASGATIILATTNLENDNVILLYPNPADDQVTIHNSNPLSAGITKVSIVNVLGQVLQSVDLKDRNEATVQMENLAAGIYFLMATTANGIWISKFVKQ